MRRSFWSLLGLALLVVNLIVRFFIQIILWVIFPLSSYADITCDFPFRSKGLAFASDDRAFPSGRVEFHTDPILGLDKGRFPPEVGIVNHQSWSGLNLVIEVATGSGKNFQLMFLDDFSNLKVFEYTSLGVSRFETCLLSSASNENGMVFCQAQRALRFSTECRVKRES
jgi:hypothetical protein